MPVNRRGRALKREVNPAWAKADARHAAEVNLAVTNPVLALISVATDALSIADYLCAYALPKDAIRAHGEIAEMREVLNTAARNATAKSK